MEQVNNRKEKANTQRYWEDRSHARLSILQTCRKIGSDDISSVESSPHIPDIYMNLFTDVDIMRSTCVSVILG